MVYEETTFTLKDGRTAILRSPCEDDAAEMLDFIRKSSGETVFLMKYPEECDSYTLEKERELFRLTGEDPYSLMIACFVDGRIAANCLLAFRNRIKEAHRASVSVTVLKEYWGLGIGTKLMEEMCRIAGEREGILQIELEFIEGNERARRLYEKAGFRITGTRPDAIRLKDGTLLNEYMMVKKL